MCDTRCMSNTQTTTVAQFKILCDMVAQERAFISLPIGISPQTFVDKRSQNKLISMDLIQWCGSNGMVTLTEKGRAEILLDGNERKAHGNKLIEAIEGKIAYEAKNFSIDPTKHALRKLLIQTRGW